MDFFKNAKVTFWIEAAGALLALLGFIFFIVSNAQIGYAIVNGGWGIFAGVVAFVAIAALAYLGTKGDQVYLFALRLVALAAIGVSFAIMIISRSAVIADLATWNGADTVGWNAFITGVISIACGIIAALTVTVTSFMKK